jgi:hypothetical protein
MADSPLVQSDALGESFAVLALVGVEGNGALVVLLGPLVGMIASLLVRQSSGLGIEGASEQALGPGEDVGRILGIGTDGPALGSVGLLEGGAGFLVNAFAELLYSGGDLVEVLFRGLAARGEPVLQLLEAPGVKKPTKQHGAVFGVSPQKFREVSLGRRTTWQNCSLDSPSAASISLPASSGLAQTGSQAAESCAAAVRSCSWAVASAVAVPLLARELG